MASIWVNLLEGQGCKCANFDAEIIPGEQNTECQARVKNIPYAVSIMVKSSLTQNLLL